MSLQTACEHHFSKSMRRRGEDYQLLGKVVSLKVAGQTAKAFVAGSDEYYVTLDWSDPEEIGVACDCPYYRDHFVCKHLWALILAVEQRGIGKEVNGRARFSNRLADLEDDEEDLDDDELDAWPTPAFIRQQKAVTVSPKRGKQSWLSDLRAVQAASASSGKRGGLWDAQPKQRHVLYVIDVAFSHTSRKLVLRLLQQERKRDGDFGKPTKLTFSRDAIETYKATPDAALLEWLAATAQSTLNYGGYGNSYSYSGISEFALPAVALPEMLPRLAATGRFFWGLNPAPPIQPGDLHAVAWDEGAPWRLQLKVTADDEQQQWLLAGRLTRDADPEGRPLSDAVFASQAGVVLWPDRVARLDAPGQDGWLTLLRQRETIVVPYGDRETFLKTLVELPQLPHVEWPANLSMTRETAEPRGYLTVFSPRFMRSKPELHGRIAFEYAGMRVRWNDPRREVYEVANQRVLERDIGKEQHLLEMLSGLGIRQLEGFEQPAGSDVAFPPSALPQIVAKLPLEKWVVEAEGNLLRRPGKFSMSVSSGVDWFELSGQFDFDGVAVTLPDILAAARKGDQYVQLGDGSRGLLPAAWLAKYSTIIDLAEEKDGKLQFKPTQAMILDALLAAHDGSKVDRKFSDFRRKLSAFDGVKPAPAPKTFIGELRPYQQDGLGWMKFLQEFGFGGCLADDMGLGKTVQVLSLLEGRRARRLAKDETRLPSLVVVPRSLIFNWQAEAQRFAPKLRVLNFSEKDRQGQWERVGEHDVVLTTYGTLLRDITKLHAQQFDYVILDEAQAIKNPNSQSAKACRLLRANHRLALTGTPIENHLGELWSLVEFLNPGMLGKFVAFSKLASAGASSSVDDAAEQSAGHALIAKAVRPILLRRTKKQVLTELPEKTEQTIYCDLTAAERKKYNELRDYYRASLNQKIDELGLEQSKIHVLEALLRLRQASCHLGLLDEKLRGGSSAKLDILLEQVEELAAEGHKALVFSQFTQLLGIVREHLDKKQVTYEYLDGQTRDRQKRVERFQTDAKCPLFLISLKAGGRGLNLTAADYVFILDPWWNPAVESQAIDRAHRIGQTQAVFAYRLIARDTVEEKILELQRTKRELADSIITADSSVLRNLTVDDLKMLLG